MIVHESLSNEVTGCLKPTDGMEVVGVDTPITCACCKVAKHLRESEAEQNHQRKVLVGRLVWIN